MISELDLNEKNKTEI